MNRRTLLRAVLGLAALPFMPLRGKPEVEQLTFRGVPVTMRTLDSASDYPRVTTGTVEVTISDDGGTRCEKWPWRSIQTAESLTHWTQRGPA